MRLDRYKTKPLKIRGVGNLLDTKETYDFKLNECFIAQLPAIESPLFEGVRNWRAFKLYSPCIPLRMTVNVNPIYICTDEEFGATVSKITVQLANVNYGEEKYVKNIGVYLEEEGKRIASTITDGDGVAVFDYSSTVKGLHSLRVYTLKQGRYLPVEAEISVYVRHPTYLPIQNPLPITLPYLESVEVVSKLYSIGENLSQREVHVYLDDVEVDTVTTDWQGISRYTLIHDPEKMPIPKKQSVISFLDGTMLWISDKSNEYMVDGLLTDIDDVRLFSRTLELYKDDKKVKDIVTNPHGLFTNTDLGLDGYGKYKLKYAGDIYTLPTEKEFELALVEFQVNQPDPNKFFVYDTIQLSASLRKNEQPAKNEPILFNDKEVLTNTDGTAEYSVMYETVGRKELTVKYNVDTRYADSTFTEKVTLLIYHIFNFITEENGDIRITTSHDPFELVLDEEGDLTLTCEEDEMRMWIDEDSNLNLEEYYEY